MESVGVGCMDNAIVCWLPANTHFYSHGRISHSDPIAYAKRDGDGRRHHLPLTASNSNIRIAHPVVDPFTASTDRTAIPHPLVYLNADSFKYPHQHPPTVRYY